MADESAYTPPTVWTWNKDAANPFASINRPDRRADPRQGAAGRPASAAALFARHAQRDQGHGHARGAAGARAPGRGVRRLADQDPRRRAVRQRLRRGQSELEDPGAARSQHRRADAGLRVRRDPALPGREVRRLPAEAPGRAGGVPVVALLADGEHAVSRRRLRSLLRLRAAEDRVCDRSLRHGGQAPARRARPPAGAATSTWRARRTRSPTWRSGRGTARS